MLVVIHTPSGEFEIELAVSEQTLSQAFDGVFLPDVAGYLVDGRVVDPSTPTEDLLLRSGSSIRPWDGPPPCATLARVGSAALDEWPLAPGQYVFGSGPEVDISVPSADPVHARIHLGGDGRCHLGYVAGPFANHPPRPLQVGEEFSVAAATFRLEGPPQPPTGSLTRRGTRSFNRPPRSEYPATTPSMRAPAEVTEMRSTARFGLVPMLVPILVGGTLAVLITPMMAMFAIFSPMMMLGNLIEDRRKIAKHRKASSSHLAEELIAVRRRLVATLAAEQKLRHRAIPDLGVTLARTRGPDDRLWERRPHHPDFLRLGLGTACVEWRPKLEVHGDAPPAPELEDLFREIGGLHDVPVPAQLRIGDVLGIAGGRGESVSLARALVCQGLVHHGPADMRLAVVTDREQDWDWAKWAPHIVWDASSGRRRIAVAQSEIDELAASLLEVEKGLPSLLEASEAQAVTLLVVDLPRLEGSRFAALRDVIAGAGQPVATVAIAESVAALPSVATTVVDLTTGSVSEPARGVANRGIDFWGLSGGAARRCARRLSALDDPDVREGGADLPSGSQLLDLLDMKRPTAASVSRRWAEGGIQPRLAAPIGAGTDGPMVIDLVADGPHALLAGTTGAGKSELLRSLVGSLAATVDSEHLNFVLVDYKGGSAFDVCEALPHTVGMVTDLDGHLAERALACLEAELRYREHRLRDAGASDLPEYLDLGLDEPLPRLLVVIDEFAALAKELPDFMAALVDIAQRGRSLGVHLLLATQRPSGVINDNIKANTNMRIALRVQDRTDSADVIGVGDASQIARSQPGRGYIRLGPTDVQPFQAALVTGVSASSAEVADTATLPFVFAAEQPAANGTGCELEGPSDLHLLVEAIVAATEAARHRTPRAPWPDALAGRVYLQDLTGHSSTGHSSTGQEPTGQDQPGQDPSGEDPNGEESDRKPMSPFATALGLADEPFYQRQTTKWWSPEDGNLLLYGVTGSGTTTAMATLVVGLAREADPNDLHMYVMDFDSQHLGPLEQLPHVGAVVAASEKDRQLRLFRYLAKELEDRRAAIAANGAGLDEFPTIVFMLDNYGGFTASYEDHADQSTRSLLARIVSDGPGVGVYTIASGKQPSAIPPQLASLVPAKLGFRLSDRYEYSAIGLRLDSVPTTPGRAFESGSGREVQIALPHVGGLAAAVAEIDTTLPQRRPWTIEVLPTEVKVPDIVDAGRIFDLEWVLPLGLGDLDLEPVGFVLREGDHALVTGPSRSGKSTALATIAGVVRHQRSDVRITAVSYRQAPLRESTDVDMFVHRPQELSGLVQTIAEEGGLQLLLVDDAEAVDDASNALVDLMAARHAGVHIIAAGTADVLRSSYGHWTQHVRRSRIGLALNPNLGTDGELWQTPLPRRGPGTFPPGRGYLVTDGRVELVQTAWQ